MNAPTNEAHPAVSVCIASVSTRGALLQSCLASLRAQRNAPAFEIIVVSDGSEAALLRDRWPEVRWIALDACPSERRQRLAAASRGTWCLFLDDDVTAPASLLANFAACADKAPEITAWGGPNLTPPGRPLVERAQGRLLANPMFSGHSSLRWRTATARRAALDQVTLCNLAVRRDRLPRFEGGLATGEESALLATMTHRGDVLGYSPDLRVWHDRRRTLHAFLRQVRGWGYGRGRVRRHAHLDLMRVLSIAWACYLCALIPTLAEGTSRLILVPLVLNTVASLVATLLRRDREAIDPASALLACTVQPLATISYAIGLVSGLTRPIHADGQPARIRVPSKWSGSPRTVELDGATVPNMSQASSVPGGSVTVEQRSRNDPIAKRAGGRRP